MSVSLYDLTSVFLYPNRRDVRLHPPQKNSPRRRSATPPLSATRWWSLKTQVRRKNGQKTTAFPETSPRRRRKKFLWPTTRPSDNSSSTVLGKNICISTHTRKKAEETRIKETNSYREKMTCSVCVSGSPTQHSSATSTPACRASWHWRTSSETSANRSRFGVWSPKLQSWGTAPLRHKHSFHPSLVSWTPQCFISQTESLTTPPSLSLSLSLQIINRHQWVSLLRWCSSQNPSSLCVQEGGFSVESRIWRPPPESE